MVYENMVVVQVLCQISEILLFYHPYNVKYLYLFL